MRHPTQKEMKPVWDAECEVKKLLRQTAEAQRKVEELCEGIAGTCGMSPQTLLDTVRGRWAERAPDGKPLVGPDGKFVVLDVAKWGKEEESTE